MDGAVVVDVPVYPADDGMEVRYAAVRLLVQPHAGLAARYVGRHGNDLAVLVQYLLTVESRRELLPQCLPVLDRKIFGMLHRRTYTTMGISSMLSAKYAESYIHMTAASVHDLHYFNDVRWE